MKIISKTISKNSLQECSSTTELSNPAEIIKSWENNFTLVKEQKNKSGLRNPQIGAFCAVVSHWTQSSELATVVLPTGTGKTETMLSLLVSEKLTKLLVIVPTDSLRTQITEKFLTLGLLRKFNIINDNVLLPVVGTIKASFNNLTDLKTFLQASNVIVATANILSKMSEDLRAEFNSTVSHIFIDEAHHSEAYSWDLLRKNFTHSKIIQFTATPFRNDEKKISGKIIYNYPLKKAQEEGYFKPINFKQIREYQNKDVKLAEKGIEQLRIDKKTYQHILLARVETKKRADCVFAIYEKYSSEFRVVKIHSGMKAQEKKEIETKIKNKKVDIIVCVDMLGEGFDLPNLKIAVFHDIRKSLSITLQFIGRFTRTKYDEELGEATIIANIADLNVTNELEVLYANDSDWNAMLPFVSENKIQQEIDIHDFTQGFKNNEEFPINVQSLKPALSTVVFQTNTDTWSPKNYQKGFSNLESYEIIQHSYNHDKKVLIIATLQKIQADWINNRNVADILWDYYIIHWDSKKNLLFINSSNNTSLHIDLAKSIIGDNAQLITGDEKGKIFRVLSGINRFKLQNVGLTEIIGKFIRFIMRVGSDIEQGLEQAAINRAKKAMIFGVGFEDGENVSLGCSHKGRIWSRQKNDVPTLIKWFNHIGKKIIDETIDAEEVLKGALIAKSLSERPNSTPYLIDWNEAVYKQAETKYKFTIDGTDYALYDVNLKLINPSNTGNIRIGLEFDGKNVIEFEQELYKDRDGNSNFKFNKVKKHQKATVTIGTKTKLLETYFYEETPSIWFINGDYLEGNNYYELKNIRQPYKASNIETWDWTGVDLNIESQKHNPKITNSIQFNVIEKLKTKQYDIIFNDDDSGEIADVITLKVENDKICIELYHLKYAINGVVSTQIKNLYEVCGQAQKSINWWFKTRKEFLEHLLRRDAKRTQNDKDSRFERGDAERLTSLLSPDVNGLPLAFQIYIVQPGISKSNISESQLTLLGVTETYLMERGKVTLKVIGSE